MPCKLSCRINYSLFFKFTLIMLSYYMIRYNFELVVIILNLKVILNEEHETYISQL